MKIKTGLTFKEREEHFKYLRDWHDWFAWYPVKVGECDYRWLETVRRRQTLERRGEILYLRWDYSQVYPPVIYNDKDKFSSGTF